MTNRVIEGSSENWSATVLKAVDPVMVFFWANWCKPCLDMKPEIAELAIEYEQTIRVVQINIDEQIDVAQDYRVSIVPTIMFFKNGKKYREMITRVSTDQISEVILDL